MQQKNRIIVSVLIFIVSYAVFLVLWLQVKHYYGAILTQVGAHLAAKTAGVRVLQIDHGDEISTITFARTVVKQRRLGDLLIEKTISVSHYSFNVPLTLSLVTSLFFIFRWRKRPLIEACLILLCVHLLFIYFSCCLELFKYLTQIGIRTTSKALQYTLQFLWAFTDNMVIRFEPFLFAAYLWLRHMKPIPTNSE